MTSELKVSNFIVHVNEVTEPEDVTWNQYAASSWWVLSDRK